MPSSRAVMVAASTSNTKCSPKFHPKRHNFFPQNPQVLHGRATEAWLGVAAGDSGLAASELGAGLPFCHHSNTDQPPGSQQPHAWLILSQIWLLFRPGSQLRTGARPYSFSDGWLQFSPWRTFGICKRVNEPTWKLLAVLTSSQSDPSLLSAGTAGQGFVFRSRFPSARSAVAVLDKGSDKTPKP